MRFLLPLLAILALAMPLFSAGQSVVETTRKAADNGDPEALYRMHMLYRKGYDTIPADSALSLRYLRMAAEAGYPAAQNYLGYILYKGEGVERDPDEGLAWLENAAIAGNPQASGNLGYLLLFGDGIRHDPANAAFWLSRAADAGVPTAASMLGDLFRDGKGVERDILRADSLYRVALYAGLPDAAYKLEELHKADMDTAPAEQILKDAVLFYTHGAPDAAVRLFHIAASGGSAAAMALLGDAYTRGLGAAYDHQASLDWYARAAAAGNPSAMFILAELLEILPDSLDTLSPEVAALFISLPRDPQSWFDAAAREGVTDAATANRRLLQPAPDAVAPVCR